MAKTDYQSVEDYIAAFPTDVQETLERMCDVISRAVPEAEAVISYQIPAFKHNGWILYVSAYTNHYAIACPPPFTVFDAFAKELEPYEVSKSSIKFPKSRPVPFELIGRMAAFRARENLERAARKRK